MNSVAHKSFSLPRAILDWPTLLNEEIVFISFNLDDATECWEEFLQQSLPSHFSFPHHLELDFGTQATLFTRTSAVYSKHNCWSKVNITQQPHMHHQLDVAVFWNMVFSWSKLVKDSWPAGSGSVSVIAPFFWPATNQLLCAFFHFKFKVLLFFVFVIFICFLCLYSFKSRFVVFLLFGSFSFTAPPIVSTLSFSLCQEKV